MPFKVLVIIAGANIQGFITVHSDWSKNITVFHSRIIWVHNAIRWIMNNLSAAHSEQASQLSNQVINQTAHIQVSTQYPFLIYTVEETKGIRLLQQVSTICMGEFALLIVCLAHRHNNIYYQAYDLAFQLEPKRYDVQTGKLINLTKYMYYRTR